MNRKQRRALERRTRDAAAQVVPDLPSNVTQITEGAQKFSKVGDGYLNFASRTGVSPGMDNQLSQSFYAFNLLTRNRIQLEAGYRGSWIVGQLVDTIAQDMTRGGVDITSNEAAERMEDFQAALSRLQIMNSLSDVKRWARLYGGAIGVMMIEGQDLASPLDIDTIEKGQFKGLAVYDRWQINPSLDQVISTGPEIGLPAYYSIITTNDLIKLGALENNVEQMEMAKYGGIRVHHSRVVRQIGVKLPYFQAITEMMWGMSVVERVHDRLVSFDNASLSAGNLINHANLRTIKIKDFREVLSAGGDALKGLYSMFDMIRMFQSSEGLTLIDMEDDQQNTQYTFSGLSDMILQFGQQLSGASGIPLVRMFGQSPAGLNSTGESDIRMYYDNINSAQEAEFRPPMERILKVAYVSEFGERPPSDMQFKFRPLWQIPKQEQAKMARDIAETVTGVYDAGIIDRATAMKELRHASAESSLFTNIDDEAIEEAENDDDGPPMPDGENAGNSLLAEPAKPGDPNITNPQTVGVTDHAMKRLAKKLWKKGAAKI